MGNKLAELGRQLLMLFRRRQFDADLDEEMCLHRELRAQEEIECGLSAEEAHYATQRRFGNDLVLREESRDMWGWNWLENLFQDVSYGLRMLRKNPGFTTVAVVTLAIGIGATTAIFSVVYGVLLRPLPYSQPDRLVELREVDDHGDLMDFDDPNFQDVRTSSRALDGVAEYGAGMESVAGASEPTRVNVAYVTHDFFPLLRVRLVMGRSFALEDHRFGAAPVALVSYAFWKQYLGSPTDLSHVSLLIENQVTPVIGVLPAGFRFPFDSDIWVPRELSQTVLVRTAHNWHVLARIREGVTLSQARSELTGLARHLKQQYGRDTEMVDVSAPRLQDWLTNDLRKPLYILLAAVGFLLLVACANVVNLLLAHIAAREREFVIRVALGAGRSRLVSQFLTEAWLLAISGGVFGVLLAHWGVHALLAIAPRGLPGVEYVSVNLPVLLFTSGLAMGVALSLGFLGAWRAVSGDTSLGLAERGQGYLTSARGQGLGRVIVAGQLAVTLVLLVGAGLLGRSLLRLLSVDPGFRTDHVLTLDLALPEAANDADRARVKLLDSVLAQLQVLPGVQEVGGAARLPLTPMLRNGRYLVMHAGDKPPALQDLEKLYQNAPRMGVADYNVASDGYFRAMGIPLRRGRLFNAGDTMDSPQVALISESMARQTWPREDPVGQVIEFGNMDGDTRLVTVVGVVGDVHAESLESKPAPTIYVNYRQRPGSTWRFTVVMHTTVAPAALIPAARKIVRGIAPDIPPSFSTFTEIFSGSLVARRFNLLLVGVFAAIALLLAVAGTYGVMAYWVAQRTREFGVRMALGAEVTEVLRLVLRQGLVIAGVGIAAGVLGSVGLTRAIESLLFGLSATDPLTFAGAAALLLLAALSACYIPARRATKVDPMVALRYE